LQEKLKKAVKKNPAEGLLFSGGLDSGILAYFCPEINAITVTLKDWGEDLKYADSLAKFYKVKHYKRVISVEESINAIPEVIKILKSFDPAIPNDITVYFGLKFAKEMGMKSIMTGDGSDELFAGYSYMRNIPDLGNYIQKITGSMYFSSNAIGQFLNIKVIQPYIDKDFINFCLGISVNLKLKKTKGGFVGKWILRKAFEGLLPNNIIWQEKRALEYGSGTTKLRKIIASKVSEKEFKRKSYPIKFINKEHFYYYKIYREEIGSVPEPLKGERACPGCGAGIKKGNFHCKVCGWTKKN